MISVEQALSLVKSNDHIVSALAPAEGAAFLGSLHTIADRVKNVTVTSCLPMGNFEYMTNRAYADSFNVDGWFFTPALRKAMPNGNVSHVPQQLSTAALKRLCHLKCNIFIGNCSMPDKHGYVSLGLSNTYETYVMERADIVILEINPNVPRTFGDVFIPVDEVDYFIDADYAIPEIPDAPCNEKDLAIGKTIAEFINDGDTIQLGIGGIPNAVAESLYGLKHLGVHTELYDFVDDNPGIMVMNGMYTNDAYVIGQNDNQISINTTLEVDLTGQCCSESLGSVQFSGSGGQADTAIGAQKSKNGKSFIALYSTAMAKNPDGTRTEVSKIVPQLKPGATVTLSRNDVQYVVTEYGVADLRGTSIRERVEKLIAVSHPKFREQLTKEAYEIGLVYKKQV